MDEDERAGRLRALAHPVRLRMLSLLTGCPAGAAELAGELGISQANASYHLRRLRGAGFLVDAGEERVRGGVLRRYRYDVDREPEGAGTGGDDARLVHEAVAAELVRRTGRVVEGPSLTTDAELWVAPETWADVVAAVRAASRMLHRAAQAPGSDGAIRVSATVALFPMASRPE